MSQHALGNVHLIGEIVVCSPPFAGASGYCGRVIRVENVGSKISQWSKLSCHDRHECAPAQGCSIKRDAV